MRCDPISVLALLCLGMLALPAAADCTTLEVSRITGNGFTVPARSVRCSDELPKLGEARTPAACADVPVEGADELRTACEEAAGHAARAARKAAVRRELRRGADAAEVATRYDLPLIEVRAVQSSITSPAVALE